MANLLRKHQSLRKLSRSRKHCLEEEVRHKLPMRISSLVRMSQIKISTIPSFRHPTITLKSHLWAYHSLKTAARVLEHLSTFKENSRLPGSNKISIKAILSPSRITGWSWPMLLNKLAVIQVRHEIRWLKPFYYQDIYTYINLKNFNSKRLLN